MSDPTVRGVTFGASSYKTSYTVTLPTGCAAGDYATVYTEGSSAGVSTNGTVAWTNEAASGTQTVWTKDLEAADITAATITVTYSGGQSYTTLKVEAAPAALGPHPDPFGMAGFTRPFTNDYFGTISSDPKIDPNSSSLVTHLLNQFSRSNSPNNCPTINYYQFTPPRYVVDSSNTTLYPTTNVTVTGAGGHGATFVEPVPLPAVMGLDNSSDSSMVVWDTYTGTVWEFWKFAVGTPTGYTQNPYSATTCAKTSTLTGNGLFTRSGNYNTDMASGISFLGTQINIHEVMEGEIKHALSMALPYTKAGAVPPAPYSDGGSSDTDALQEGLRFFFPSSVVMPSGLQPFAQIVFRAIQKYGVFIGDTSGTAAIYAENQASWQAAGLPSPYTALFSGGTHGYDILKNLPWSQLQVLASTF